uniref:Glycosyltransferase n=1 Tax=viral metagenome TaxID=1070528 RepID=A0A6C0JHD7_9ZZZZ
MFTKEDICVFLFNWKKVTQNSLRLYEKIRPIIKNTTIVNCDESCILDPTISHIQLDDSHYYGSQYNHAIKHMNKNALLCVIVGDNIVDNDFNAIFENALTAFNTLPIGVFSPRDKRTMHQQKCLHIQNDIFTVNTTDCGFWFIHPLVISALKNMDYSISKYGWGIDTITIKEANKMNLLCVTDFSIETDQVDHSCGYDTAEAEQHMHVLNSEYLRL